jgi:hypothetical protein
MVLGTIAAGIALGTLAGSPMVDTQIVPGTREALNSSNTLFGPTGLIRVPTAYVTPHSQVQFSASFGKDLRGPAANWGITPGVEVGGAFMDREGLSNKAIANAKVNIIPQNFEFFEVGVGVIDAADAISRSYYVVGSADFEVPRRVEQRAIGFRLHAGVGTGMFEENLIGGGELVFDRQFSVIGEWDAENFNAVLRYAHDEFFRIQAGLQHTDLFLGATYAMQF